MAYSPAPLALDRTKPSPWNAEQAFVAPEYQGLWRDLFIAIPLWEGSSRPYEIRGRTFEDLVGSPSWVTGGRGPGLSFNGSSQYVQLAVRGQQLGSQILSHMATFVIQCDSTSLSALTGTFNDGTTTGYQILVNSNDSEAQSTGRIYAFVRDETGGSSGFNGATTADTGITDGGVHIVSVVIDYNGSPQLRIVVDGVDYAVATEDHITGSTVDFDYDPLLAARNVRGTVDRHFDGDIYWAAWHVRVPSLVEIQRWHHDIWGVIRPNWDYVTAAAFDPANLQATVDGSDVTYSWDASF